MATVSLRRIRKNSGVVTIIDDLSINVANKFVVLLGPSGCGKIITMRPG